MAQTEVENQLVYKVHKLQKAGIDTIVHFRENFGGMLIPLNAVKKDSCYAVDKMYLFWLNNGKAYVQRFDNCLKHAPERINPYFINFFSNCAKTIKAENILPAQYEEPLFLGMFKNKVTLFVAHCGYVKFEYYQRGNSFVKEFDDYGLHSKYLDRNKQQLNINYEHNHNTIIYNLMVLIKKQIKELKLN